MALNNTEKLEKEINQLINMLQKNDNAIKKTKIHFTLIMLLEVFNEASFLYSSEYCKYQKTSYAVQEYVRKTILQQLTQTYDKEYENIIIKIITSCQPIISNFKHYNIPQTKTFTIDEVKMLILDFFSEFDKSLIPIINKALSDENLFIKTHTRFGFPNNQRDGFTSYNYYSKSPFIFIDNCGKEITLDTLSTIVHELGHTINAHLNFQFSNTNFNNLSEVPSCTFDLLFLMYLLKNNILIEDTEKQINLNIKSTIESIKILIEANSQKLSLENLGFSSLNSLDTDPYKYSFGHLLAYYYIDLYKQDKEKTKYNLYEFIKNIGIKDDMYMLSHFGINKDEFISCKSLKQEIERNQKVLTHLKNKQH